ncbi:MAG: hypothetical protein GY801_21435 [bacterium]|nr:hypothetical protein [bacterium]
MLTVFRTWWTLYHRHVFKIGVILMACVALVWLGYELYRLLWQPERIGRYEVLDGGIDLKLRYQEVDAWFDGIWVYRKKLGRSSLSHDTENKQAYRKKNNDAAGQRKRREKLVAFYPPASFMMLWPFLGWLSLDDAIIFWAAASCCLLGWFVSLLVRESGAASRIERLFIGLIPLAIYASGATIGNGQLPLHLLPPLLTGLLLCDRKMSGWQIDVLIAVMVLFSLTKPSLTVPFFWILLFRPRGLRPALLVIGGYLALTYWASLFQSADMLTLIQAWLKSPAQTAGSAGGRWTHGNIHSLLAMFGLGAYALYGSAVLLVAQGIWTVRNRQTDMWILMGVAGLTARFWMYHLWYDDLVVLPAMLALFRIAKHEEPPRDYHIIAGLLFGMTLLVMIAPGGQYLLPIPWNRYFMMVQTTIWLAVLVFLVVVVHKKWAGE